MYIKQIYYWCYNYSQMNSQISDKRILIHFHVFYIEQLPMFIRLLKNVQKLAETRIIATVVENLDTSEEIEKQLKNGLDNVEVIKVRNRGYDVGPFVEALHHADLDDYDCVIKLHTKSRGNTGGTVLNDVLISNSLWENIMIDALIGSRERFIEAIETVSRDDVGMACAEMCLTKDDEVRNSYYFWRVNDELAKMHLPLLENKEELVFAAGTMFIIRADILKPLLMYSIDDFGMIFPGIHDYTLAHTFERLFAALALSRGLRVAGLDTREYRLDFKRIKMQNDRKNRKAVGDSFFGNAGTFMTKLGYKLMSRFDKEWVISNSKFFDVEWYSSRHPEIRENGLDPVRHYLEHGCEYGCNPSLSFNGYEYLSRYPDLLKKKINPLLHYECYGRFEHRNFNNVSIKWNTRIDTIRNSRYFDEEWYLRYNPDVRDSGIDPALHYYQFGGFEGRDPSERFCTDEYLSIHKDVKSAGINPLFHYEYDGYIQGREISSTEFHKPVFAQGTKNCGRFFGNAEVNTGRTVLLASYSNDGYIDDSLIYLIKGLKEIADNIVLFADSPVFEEELDKLDGLVTYAGYERHGAYDFGSYRRGLDYLRKNGYLEEGITDELIMMNDSCYGPVYPFSESIDKMKNEDWDFWGYVGNWSVSFHLCSFFYVFNRKIIESRLLDEFMCRVDGEVDRSTAISEFEIKLTEVLSGQGMKAKAFVADGEERGINHRNILTLLRDYRVPLIKKRSLNGDAKESIVGALKIIERDNPELYSHIKLTPVNTTHDLPVLEDHVVNLEKTVRRIRRKISDGNKVKAVFFVNNISMFPAKPLFDQMCDDDLFDPCIIVIPDKRVEDPYTNMVRCESELSEEYPEDRIIKIRKDRYDRWPDVLDDADIVVYPVPYNISVYKYNVRYSLGRDYLPVIVNYGYYRSLYDRSIMSSYNYAYFWKVFMESEYTMKEYEDCSVLKGKNGELVGYIKMDLLNDVEPETRKRKRVLIALHHSIEGGFNDRLALANFIRYYDYFETLPDRYPDIDFVYRPHPFLFESLKQARNWNDDMVRDYLDRMKSKKNVIWSDNGDYFREFMNSDACIQDCGSFLVEYMYTGKPCCYMLKDESDIDSKFAPLGKECLEQCYISYSSDDIDAFIDDVVIHENDVKKQGREKLSKSVMVNYPNAARVALDSIRRALKGEKDA